MARNQFISAGIPTNFSYNGGETSLPAAASAPPIWEGRSVAKNDTASYTVLPIIRQQPAQSAIQERNIGLIEQADTEVMSGGSKILACFTACGDRQSAPQVLTTAWKQLGLWVKMMTKQNKSQQVSKELQTLSAGFGRLMSTTTKFLSALSLQETVMAAHGLSYLLAALQDHSTLHSTKHQLGQLLSEFHQQIMQSKQQLQPDEVVQIAFSCCKTHHYSAKLLEFLAKKTVLLLPQMHSHQLTRVAWSLARLNQCEDTLLQKLIERTTHVIDYLNLEQTATLAWAFARLHWPNPGIFASLLDRASKWTPPYSTVESHCLAVAADYYEAMKWDLNDHKRWIRALAKYANDNVCTSHFHRQVTADLRERGLRLRNEVRIGYSSIVDILIPKADLVIEVDGPHHEKEEQKQSDNFKEFLLNQKGYSLKRVNLDTWNDIEKKESFIAEIHKIHSDKKHKKAKRKTSRHARKLAPEKDTVQTSNTWKALEVFTPLKNSSTAEQKPVDLKAGVVSCKKTKKPKRSSNPEKRMSDEEILDFYISLAEEERKEQKSTRQSYLAGRVKIIAAFATTMTISLIAYLIWPFLLQSQENE